MIESLFGTFPVKRFFDDYYLRLPFAISEMGSKLRALGDWSMIESITSKPGADALVVRSGQRHPEDLQGDFAKLRSAVKNGYTLVFRHAERFDAQLAELATEFAELFSGDVDVHLYCTPAAQFGFGWHYDAEEVFILQTTGDKTYSLRKNTVNPWPVADSLPNDMRYEREIMPISRCTLKAGDWLYIPSGYWHMGHAREESISLAIGVTPTTGLDVFDFLRKRLLDSLLWRRRFVPPNAWHDETSLQRFYAQALAELADDFGRTIRSEQFIADFVTFLRNPIRQ